MSTEPITGRVSKDEILATFADAINEKYVKGERGHIGLEGRSPIHVMEETPSSDVQKGDLWYNPSDEKSYLYTGKKWKEVLKQGIIGLEGVQGERGNKIYSGSTAPTNPISGDLWLS